MRALVVGGFEPSGHDAVLNAVSECAAESGIDVASIAWRQMIPGIDDHIIFHLHRLHAEGPSLSALMDDPALADYLAEDLWRRVPNLTEYDAVISVHPWSTVIVARALLEQKNISTILADCNVNWGPIPDIEVPRVDVFCGGLVRRPVRPAIWRRCFPTGVPVRKSFRPIQTETVSGKVCIGSGRLGRVPNSAIDAFNKFRSIVPFTQLIVAGASRDESQWRMALGPDIDIIFVPDIDDVSSYWKGAEWVITKGSAASVAEAFAVGAKVVGVTSGVLWEDNCMALLASRGALIPIDLLGQSSWLPDLEYWRELSLGASQRCVDLVAHTYSGTSASTPPEITVPMVLTAQASEDLLPETSRWLIQALRRWNAEA